MADVKRAGTHDAGPRLKRNGGNKRMDTKEIVNASPNELPDGNLITYEKTSSPPAEPSPRLSQPRTSTEVLITPQQVLFGTVVTAPRPRNRLLDMLLHVFASLVAEPHPRPPKERLYLERARMGREMDRL
jgi:hypothetical protein